MRKLFQSNYLTVLVLFLIAILLSAMAYPEVFVSFTTSLALWSDYCIEYPLTFILTNFFYQGGIQLWDFYGQMPFFHTYVAYGLFKLPSVITAIVYYVLAPFSEDSSRLFYHVFIWVNLMTLLFIRLAGIFLLLKTVTRSRVILTIGTVVAAVILDQWAFSKGEFWLSYLPLGMYFVVRFFQQLQWRYLAAIFLFLAISLASGMHYGGYMYLPMHFFIIAGILWRVCFRPGPRKPMNNLFRNVPWGQLGWVIVVAVLMMAPYAYIVKFGFPDLAFGQADSRISHPFSPYWYFHNPNVNLGNPSSFWSSILNFHTNVDTFYFGISFLFLAMAGLFLSSNTLKWFFGTGIVLLWLLSFPREGINIGLIAHWINALTNPLKTIPRGYPYAFGSMLFYLLMPLGVMGIEAIRELYRGKKYSGQALLTLAMTMFLLMLISMATLPPGPKAYLIISTILIIATIAFVHFRNSSLTRNFFLMTVCFLTAIDVFLIIHQSKMELAQWARKPIVLDAAPQSAMVGYDFENPSIFPYRYSYTFNFSYRDEIYLWFPHGVSSDLHHVINQELNFAWLNGLNPRHVEFLKWLHDPSMWTYLTQNNEFIFSAQTAIKASPDALSRICSAGLSRRVAEVEDPQGKLKLPDQWPGGIINNGDKDDWQYNKIVTALEDVTDRLEYHLQGDMIVYTWHLPSGFPAHLTSSLFPAEQRYLRFFVEGTGQQWQELQAIQGELIRPYTFDVQNIKKGELKAAFPMNDFPLRRKCALLYPSTDNQGVEGLWRRQFDNLGITYRAKRDGWWVGHYPYDSKWRISVDGKPVTYYRVNESFIGFPLARGEHKILIQYWPHSPLRILLLISALLMTLGLPALIFLGLKWEQKGGL